MTLSVIGCDENVLRNVNWIKLLISRSERMPNAGSYRFLLKTMVFSPFKHEITYCHLSKGNNHDAFLTSENP